MANNLLKRIGDYNSSGQSDNAPSAVVSNSNLNQRRSRRESKVQFKLHDAVNVMFDGVKFPGYIMRIIPGSRFDTFMPSGKNKDGTTYEESVATVGENRLKKREGPKYEASNYVIEIQNDEKPSTPKTAKKMKLEKKRKYKKKVASGSSSKKVKKVKKVKKEKSILAIERQFLKLYRTNGNVKNTVLQSGNGDNNPQNNADLDIYLKNLKDRMELAKNNEVVCACDTCNAARVAALQAAALEDSVKDEGKKSSKNEVKSEGSKNEVKSEGSKIEVKSEGSKNEVKPEASTATTTTTTTTTTATTTTTTVTSTPSTTSSTSKLEEAVVKDELDSLQTRKFAKIRNRILFKRFDDIGAGLSSGYQNTFEQMKSPGHVYGLHNLCQNLGWSPDAPTLPGRSGAISGTPAHMNVDGTFHYFQKREKLSRHGSHGTMWEYMGRYKKSDDVLKSYGSSKCLTEENKRIVKASVQKRSTWRQEPCWKRWCIKYDCTMDEVLDKALEDPLWWTMDNVEFVDYDEDLYRYLVFWQRERGHLKGHEFKKTIAGSFIQENWSQYPVVEGHRPYQQQDRADPSNLNQVAAGIIGGI